MKLVKSILISFAVVGIFSSAVTFADDDWVNVYGKLNVTMDKVDDDAGDKQWELSSHASRFGVKGKGSAGDGLTAFYKLEWEVDVTDKAKDNLKSRNQIVGVRGGFGEVFLGRHDTPTKALQKKIDLFGDLRGDIKHTFNGEKRASNIVQYSTPKISGFKIKTAFIPGEQTGTNDGLADGTSVALEYHVADLNIGLSLDSDVEKDGVDTTRLMAQYKIGDWRLGLLYQSTDHNTESGDGLMVSAKYISGANAYKIQLINSDSWKAGVSSKVKYSSQSSFGFDHKLGKKMTAYGYLTLGEVGATGDNAAIFGVGFILKF